MTTSAAAVIAAIQSERPGLSEAKTQLLLFFCAGHHLDHQDKPLFGEPLYATETGVRIDVDRDSNRGLPGDEAVASTVLYVLSRYGNLSPADLRTLITASQPWQSVRPGEPIDDAHLTAWFRRAEERNDPDDDRPTAAVMTAFAAYREKVRGRS